MELGDSSPKHCRICYLEDENGELIDPCHCKGSMRYVHRKCLEDWIKPQPEPKCEVCGTVYEVHRVLPGWSSWWSSTGGTPQRWEMLQDAVLQFSGLYSMLTICVHFCRLWKRGNFSQQVPIAVIVLFQLTCLMLALGAAGLLYLLFDVFKDHYSRAMRWRLEKGKVELLLKSPLGDGSNHSLSRRRTRVKYDDAGGPRNSHHGTRTLESEDPPSSDPGEEDRDELWSSD